MGLTLTRSIGDEILIGDDIVVVVKEIRRRGSQVRLEILAPSSVPIDRGEIRRRKEREAEVDGRGDASSGRAFRAFPDVAPNRVECPRCKDKGTDCGLCEGEGLVDEDIARAEIALQQLRSR